MLQCHTFHRVGLENVEDEIALPNGGIASLLLKVFTSICGKTYKPSLTVIFYNEVCAVGMARVTSPTFLC